MAWALLFILFSRDEVSFCAVIDGDGEVTDFLRLPHIMKRKNGWNKDDAALKVNIIHDVISTKQSINFTTVTFHCVAEYS